MNFIDDQKKCITCGRTFRGRSDKKFCNDQCRNYYNNALRSDSINYIRNINNCLRKNRRLLNAQLASGETQKRISLLLLLSHGFLPDYFTEIRRGKKGVEYFFCYDIGYRKLGSHQVMIVRKEVEKGVLQNEPGNARL